VNKIKIVVLPQVSRNKGDRAVLHFMLDGFIDNGVNEITVATTNPKMWEGYHGFRGANIRFIHQAWMIYASAESKVPFRSLRYYCLRMLSTLRTKFYIKVGYSLLRTAVVNRKFRSLARLMCYLCNRELWNAIKQADAVVTTGGHRITTLLQPDVVGPQTFCMAMVVLASRKLYLWSQTIGAFDFKKEINRELIKKILTYSERIYVRDINSMRELKGFLTDESKVYQTYDSVFGLRRSVSKYCEVPPSKRDNVLGISVYTSKSGRKIGYERYIYSLAELVKRATDDGLSVKFFPMHIEGPREHKFFTDIIEQSGCADKCCIVDSHIDTIEHLKQLARCKAFVGHKTHSIVFALLTATPLISIAYHVKSLDFMKQFGVEEYGFDESETTPEKLVNLYEKILLNADSVHDIERNKVEYVNEKVNKDFSDLIAYLRQTVC
jgi:polysaccharide pyruvyl transferase WcaK-like protein